MNKRLMYYVTPPDHALIQVRVGATCPRCQRQIWEDEAYRPISDNALTGYRYEHIVCWSLDGMPTLNKAIDNR